MAKTETQIDLKINKGTYAKIQENLNSIQDNELIITTDKNVPVPTQADAGKFFKVDTNGEFDIETIKGKEVIGSYAVVINNTDLNDLTKVEGALAYNQSDGKFYICDGTNWSEWETGIPVIEIETSTTSTNPITLTTMASISITNEQSTIIQASVGKRLYIKIHSTLYNENYWFEKTTETASSMSFIFIRGNSDGSAKSKIDYITVIQWQSNNANIIKMYPPVKGYEIIENKKASVASNSSSDTYYPTTKAVYDFVKGETKYLVVSDYSALPTTNVSEGTLAYVQSLYVSYEPGFYQYKNSAWSKIELENLEPIDVTITGNFDVSQTYTFTIDSDDILPLLKGATLVIGFTGGGASIFRPDFFQTSQTTYTSSAVVVLNGTQYIATINFDISSQTDNATLSFSEIEGGSGGGVNGVPKYRLYFKQFYNSLTLNRGESGDTDFTMSDVNRVLGYDFYSKDIVTRYNEYITFVNSQYGTSFSSISSANEIANSIKTLLGAFVLSGLTELQIMGGLGVLIRCLSLQDGISLTQVLASQEYNSYENMYPMNCFGTTKGNFDTESIFEYSNFYNGVGDGYSGMLGAILPNNVEMSSFTTTSNESTTLTGSDAIYLSLVDNYDCVLETLDIGGGSSQPTIPERFSIAYNLVVNMNQEQFANGSWTGSNSDNIRTFQYNGSNADEAKARELVEFLTGVNVLDEYNATKPTPCFVFTTQANICWKLQWDNTVLHAYKVDNFPFVVKKKYYEWALNTATSNGIGSNHLTFKTSETLFNDLLVAVNQVMSNQDPTWQDITDKNGLIALFNQLKLGVSDPDVFSLIVTLFGIAGQAMLDEKAQVLLWIQDTSNIDWGNYYTIDRLTSLDITIVLKVNGYSPSNNLFGVFTSDSSNQDTLLYIDSNATLSITETTE